MTLTQDDMTLIFEIVGTYAAWTGFLFYAFGWMFFKVAEFLVDLVRKRGARVPFAQRAAELERRAQRSAAFWSRVAERNRRESARHQ